MSTHLYWRPVPKPAAEVLPSQLKYTLAQRYFDHDGTLRSDPIVFSTVDVPYLTGLSDAKVEGAQELVAAIVAHGSVEVWIDE